MNRLWTIMTIVTILMVFFIFKSTRVTADELPPALPPVFYGEVWVNGETVTDGTTIVAKIEGVDKDCSTEIEILDDISVYVIKLIGDESMEGAEVIFFIDGVQATHLPVEWRKGTSTQLDLTITDEQQRLFYLPLFFR